MAALYLYITPFIINPAFMFIFLALSIKILSLLLKCWTLVFYLSVLEFCYILLTRQTQKVSGLSSSRWTEKEGGYLHYFAFNRLIVSAPAGDKKEDTAGLKKQLQFGRFSISNTVHCTGCSSFFFFFFLKSSARAKEWKSNLEVFRFCFQPPNRRPCAQTWRSLWEEAFWQGFTL